MYVFYLPVACKYPRCQFGQQCVEVCTNQIPWHWNYFYCYLEAAVQRENNINKITPRALTKADNREHSLYFLFIVH